MILLKLILAHFAGDFLFQPKKWVIEKESKKFRSGKLYLHLFIHGLISLILLWDLSLWPVYITIIVLHGIIDLLKLYLQKPDTKIKWLLADQILHLLSLVAIYMIWFRPSMDWLVNFINKPEVWVYALAVILITVVAGIIIQVLMQNWSEAIKKHDPEKESVTSLKNAGKYIGILERLFVFVFIVTGHWEGIGFLLAAKSIFRFGDLKESKDIKLTEYILIGTLLSFSLAVGTALLVPELINFFNS